MKFSLVAAGLFISSVFASQYTASFNDFEGAVACLSKDVKYIKKVSGNVQVHGQDLVVISTNACSASIQDNLSVVCSANQVTCQE